MRDTSTITKQMFLDDMMTFRKLMGERSSWQSGLVDRAWKGLALVFILACATGRAKETTDKCVEQMITTFEACQEEYARRGAYVAMYIAEGGKG